MRRGDRQTAHSEKRFAFPRPGDSLPSLEGLTIPPLGPTLTPACSCRTHRAEGALPADATEARIAELEHRNQLADLALLQQFAANEFVDWQGSRVAARWVVCAC